MDDYQYAQEVPADLLCAVCYHALREPRCCPRCSASFCEQCITTWASTQKRKEVPFSCPYCRARLRLSQLFPPEALEGRLGALPVLCPHSCSPAPIRRADLADHLSRACPGAPATCPDCGAAMRRGQLPAHVGSSSCSNRRLSCANRPLGCPAQLQLHDMPYHAAACPYEPLACRHCGAAVLRGQAEEHTWAGCPARCPCPNRCFGCEYVAPSLEQLVQHVERGNCRYDEDSAYMARMRGALGPGDLMYGRLRSGSGMVGGGGGGQAHAPSPYPHRRSFEGRWQSSAEMYGIGPYAASAVAEAAPTAAGGTWCHGLFVPASLYPNGLPDPPPPPPHQQPGGNGGGDEANGTGGAAAAAAAGPPPPWPWAVVSTREVSDAAAAVEQHFTPASNAGALRQLGQQLQGQQLQGARGQLPTAAAAGAVVPERYRRLLEELTGEVLDREGEGEDQVYGSDQGGREQQPGGCGDGVGAAAAAAAAAAAGGDAAMADANADADTGGGGGKAVAAEAGGRLRCELELELPPADPFWWRREGGGGGDGPGARKMPPAAEDASMAGVEAEAAGAKAASAAAAAPSPLGDEAAGAGQPLPAGASPGGAALARRRTAGDAEAREREGEEGMDDLLLAHHTDFLTLPASVVYGTVIDLAARLYDRGDGGGAGGSGGADIGADGNGNGGDGGGGGGPLAGELPEPPEGSRDARLLALYAGEDNSLLDLPACDTALHHGYRAVWALGLLRLARRHWPAARLTWRALAGLNDLVTGLARGLLSEVVRLVGCELVQESAPAGEGDVMLAVQTLFPPALAAEALAAVRHTLRMYDDAFWDSDLWLEGWSSLRLKLDLGLDLGRVACVVGQYTPLHGEFVAGENDPDTGNEGGDDDDNDDDESDDDISSSDDDDDGGGADSNDNGDIEEPPRRFMRAGAEEVAREAAALTARRTNAGAACAGRRHGRSSSSSSSSSESIPSLEPVGSSFGSVRNAGVSGFLPGGMRAPVQQMLEDAGLRMHGLALRTVARGGSGGGGGAAAAAAAAAGGSGSEGDDGSGGGSRSDTSGEWESIDEEEAAVLLQQEQQQQERQQPEGQQPEGQQQQAAGQQQQQQQQQRQGPGHPGGAAGAGGGASSSEPPHWWQRRLNERMGFEAAFGGGGSGGRGGDGGSDGFSDELDVASSGSSSSDSGRSHADIRGVAALAAALEWFVGRLLGVARSHVEAGLTALGEGGALQPWHLQLTLDTSALGQVMLPPGERPQQTAALTAPAPGSGSNRIQLPGGSGSGSWDGPSVGSRLAGSLPLGPLAHMLASLALQPVSALLVLATAGTAAGAGAGAAAAGASAPPPPPPPAVLCPLDMRCYCGGPARPRAAAPPPTPASGASTSTSTSTAGAPARAVSGAAQRELSWVGPCGPPCSFWSGYQCSGCAAATARVRRLPPDCRLQLCGGVLRSTYAGACADGEEGQGGGGGQQQPQRQGAFPAEGPSAGEAATAAATPLPAAPASLQPPGDLVAAVTGGRLRGELLALLLPPPLRPLLQPPALPYAARLANLGLASGLLRIHHLDVPCWWREPGGTAFGTAAATPAAALSPALASAVRPDPAWLQELQPHLAALRDVEAAAALCRDLGAVLYGTPAADEGGRGAVPTASAPAPTADADAAEVVARGKNADSSSSADGGDDSSTGAQAPSCGNGDSGNDGGSSGGDGGGGGGGGSRDSNLSAAVGTHELPLCIPGDVFMELFHECLAEVRRERSGGQGPSPAAAPAAASGGAVGQVLPIGTMASWRESRPLDQQQPGDQPQSQPHQPQQPPQLGSRRRRGRLSMPPAMGVAGDGPVRRRFRPTPVPLRSGATAAAAAAATATAPAATPPGGAMAGAAVATGAGSQLQGPGRGGAAASATAALWGAAADVTPAAAAAEGMEVDADATAAAEGMEAMEVDWSADALELLQRAAEAALMEALREGAACGGGGGGGGHVGGGGGLGPHAGWGSACGGGLWLGGA